MKLDFKRIGQATIQAGLQRWPRIIPALHAVTPIGAGYGSSRFSSTTHAFRVLYAAEDFATSFAEVVVRDRFVGKRHRYLYRPFLEQLMVTEVGSKVPLNLLDFTGDAAYELGIDTDAMGARLHTVGQELAEALHGSTKLDGILYDSRMTQKRCVGVFDRAFTKLTGRVPIDLVRLAALTNEIRRLEITIRRKRAY